MPRCHLIVFDLDGTLVDSSVDLADAANHTLSVFGFPPKPVPEIARYVGDGARKLVERALPAGVTIDLDEAVRVFLGYYEESCTRHTRLYSGMDTLLHACAGIPKAVATNKPKRFTDKILKALRVEGEFIQIECGDTVAKPKPDPEMLRKILAPRNIAPMATFMVGDSSTDVKTAQAAGVVSVGAAWGFRGREELEKSGANYIIERPVDLVQLIG
ncbi:MAG: HAD-IA family hydrolase [Deltaproteobacteria bacterium]|nr:HAD-IA family hydrolase [Deltaproteobacteria bacterium]